ncbi:MAG: peptidylprolyl isomerase [candidate division WOR-3 bacterium]|nr:peptidylprolyl isomerase [candidate division WOR-3 bacterium]MCX7836441.1 peptidylprolyl isomerase [candidate division WOR-3 bacterium]MDW8114213.1 peptidylprolyl isomerase [candidate division WOR-3 bacterium]
MKKIIISLLVILIIFSCREEKPVIKIGNKRITKEEILAQIPEGVNLNEQNLLSILERIVNSELIYLAAQEKGLTKNKNLQMKLKALERDFFANALIEEEAKKISISQKEILDYYNQHKEDFLSEVKIRRIVVYDEALANKIYEELKSGKDFVSLAKEYSQDQLLPAGEESKYFPRGFLTDPILEEEIFSLKINEFTSPIKSQEGYQIIQLVDKKRVKKEISLSEVEEYVRQILRYKKGYEILNKMLSDLKEKYKVSYYPENFFK